jgi:Methylase involved in ubiquinone/menaquinone biosynthesis
MKNIADHFNEEAKNHDNFFGNAEMKPFYDEIEIQINKCVIKGNILVLGCGTGLEIEKIKSKSKVTAVDISQEMLNELRKKNFHEDIELSTICGSLLDMDLGNNVYDIVLTCYVMHHFNEPQKLSLYSNIHKCLKSDGVFINGDIMANTKEDEISGYKAAENIYREQNKQFGSLHIDVPMYYEHELGILNKTGFNNVTLEREWTHTKLYRACK